MTNPVEVTSYAVAVAVSPAAAIAATVAESPGEIAVHVLLPAGLKAGSALVVSELGRSIRTGFKNWVTGLSPVAESTAVNENDGN